jgi:hypothetical protein
MNISGVRKALDLRAPADVTNNTVLYSLHWCHPADFGFGGKPAAGVRYETVVLVEKQCHNWYYQ